MEDDSLKGDIFKGFGDDKGKGRYTRFFIPLFGIIIIAGLLIYMVFSFIGNSGDATGSAVRDLSEDDKLKQAAAEENERLLGEIGLNLGDGTVTSEGVAGDANGNSAGTAANGAAATSTATTITSKAGALSSIIELREYNKVKKTIEIARMVTDISGYVDKVDNSQITNPWQTIISCAYEGCDDSSFVNMIDAIATTDMSATKNQAIHSLIETYNYWDGRNTVLFSGSITKTNKLILTNFGGSVIGKWNEMITCNGKCDNFKNNLFELIEMLNNY